MFRHPSLSVRVVILCMMVVRTRETMIPPAHEMRFPISNNVRVLLLELHLSNCSQSTHELSTQMSTPNNI